MPIQISFLLDHIRGGGAERHGIMLANAASRDLFSVGIDYLKPGDGLLPLVKRDDVIHLDCLDVRHWLDLRAAARFGAARKADGTHLVVAANLYSTLYAVAAKRLTGAPYSVIATYHTTLLRTWRERLHMLLFKRAVADCASLVYMSDYQRKYWEQRGLRAASQTRIYNGVDTRYFSPDATLTPAEWPAGWRRDEDYIIGICAGLRPEKAHGDLLQAIGRLVTLGLPVRCLMIGEGPEQGSIERAIREMNLEGRVCITGFKADVRPYLQLCDVMVLTSQTETFSLASLESMSMGLPMVMSDVGGAREQITDGDTGLLFPQGDVAALTQCLARLFPADLRRAMGAKAMRNVHAKFSLERMVHQYEQLFLGVAHARAKSFTAAAL